MQVGDVAPDQRARDLVDLRVAGQGRRRRVRHVLEACRQDVGETHVVQRIIAGGVGRDELVRDRIAQQYAGRRLLVQRDGRGGRRRRCADSAQATNQKCPREK